MLIKNKTFYIVTIGCRTNACESDIINNQLINESAIRANSLNEANIVIVNTCCVTAKAESKSKYYINQAIRSTRCELVIMVGCLSQVNTKLFHHPKIGIVIGNKVKNKLIDYIRKYKHNQPIVDIKKFSKTDVFDSYDSINFLNKTRAFVKIQDGCDCMCSYCIIPFVRGRQRSLEHHKVLSIINQLVKNGHQEIVLTGVNTAGYRENNKYGFWELLKDINKLKGNFRVRISSLEPFQIDKRIIDLLTDNPKRWCQQFHICLQSGSNEVIKAMKRKYVIKDFFNLCKYIRTKNKLASITTDCIVGFPAETKANFDTTCKNLIKLHFADIHVFPYSPRPFTLASKSSSLISAYEKKQRCNIVNEIRNNSQKNYLKKFIGKTVNILFEKSHHTNVQIGHSEYFFTVNVITDQTLFNKLIPVKITKLENNQLIGALL